MSVAQAFDPFPQFRDINTSSGAGDKSGHSSYHALVLKLDKRYAAGLTLQGSYVFSKLITDADGYQPDNGTLDHYNRRLEKSIGEFDLTHNLKMTYIYELPFGKGKRGSPADRRPGSWAAGASPAAISTRAAIRSRFRNNASIGAILFNGRSAATVTTYDGWIAEKSNPDWKGADRYFQPPSFFGPQPTNLAGNTTRHNPKARQPWNLNENFSLAKSFRITEAAPYRPALGDVQRLQPVPSFPGQHQCPGPQLRPRAEPAQRAAPDAVGRQDLLLMRTS